MAMKLKNFSKQLKETIKIASIDLIETPAQLLNAQMSRLDQAQLDILNTLRKDGIAVIPNYWSREKAFEIRDKLNAYMSDGENHDFDNGAYIRHWGKDAAAQYGRGISRIYHPDQLLPELSEHRYNPYIMDIIHAYYGRPYHSHGLMFQHNLPGFDTGYFHIDAFKKEFKTFIYLDDVNEDNGPFVYIKGTPNAHWRRLRQQMKTPKANGNRTNFEPDDLETKYKEKATPILGNAGTLILADVRGFHRGAPQQGNARSALVNYILKKPGKLSMEK